MYTFYTYTFYTFMSGFVGLLSLFWSKPNSGRWASQPTFTFIFFSNCFFLSILLTLFSSQIRPLHQQGCTQTQEVLQYKFELYPRSQLEGNTKALTRNKTTTKCIDQRTYTAANKKSQQTIPLNYFPHVPTLSKEVHNGSLQQFATIFHQDAFSLF